MGAGGGELRTYLGRYAASAVLKDGGGVRTLRGTDTEGGAPVVIKAAPVAQVPESGRRRLEHEAQVLERLESRWAVPLEAVGTDGDLLCVVMPLVPGVTLAEALRTPLSVRETLSVATCVLGALADAHAIGVLHRDVKPSNVIVDGSPVDRATLIDFGLSRSEWLDPTLGEVPVGTARYMSPEQAGLLDLGVDERSDLFGAGALLFECLAGRARFTGDTLGEVLRQHMAEPPPGLRAQGLDVPRAVDDLVARLLHLDPRDRYQSAAAVLADLADITAALERGDAEPSVVVGLRDRRRTVAEAAFVGRDRELARLERELASAREGRGGLVLVEAESGGGKSRLLDELARRAAAEGTRVFRGQAVSEAAQRPFEVMTGVAASIVRATQTEPELVPVLRERLGERSAAVCAALPELEQVLGADAGATGPEQFGETRTIEALGALLDGLGSEASPALVLLDDCQWADELTSRLLTRGPLPTGPARHHTLVVVAFRTEEVGSEHPLRRARRTVPLRLAPLQRTEVEQLVESMVGPVPVEAIETVATLSEGSPFMAAAVLRGLVESGALVDAAEGWRIDTDALTDVRASRQAAALLSRRLELLPPEVLRFLSVGAVLGKAFDPDLAAGLAGLDAAADAVAEARRRHILWSTPGRCVFVHDKLRETVLERLDAGERAGLHLEAARRLAVVAPDRMFDLAYHFDAAGHGEAALPHALEAAAQARAQHALDVAHQQYEIAQRCAGRADVATRLEIAEGLGVVLTLRGRYDDARSSLEAAARLAEDPTDRARVQGELGEVAFKQGDMETAIEQLEQGLRTLGRWMPRRRAAFVVSAAFEVVVQVLHTLLPRAFVGRRRLDAAEIDLRAVRLHSRLAHAYWFGRGTVPTLWTHLRGLNLAERYPPTEELAQACSEHAPVTTLVTLYGRGEAYARRSLAIRTELGNVWGQGRSLHFLGVVLYGASRFEECIESCRAAVELLERTGDRWELNTASWHIAFSHYRLGDLVAAAEAAREVHRAGVEIGDPQARGISLGGWSKATDGRVPEDLVAHELERPVDDVHTSAEVLQAEAVRLLGLGEHGRAAEVLERADHLVRAAGLRQEYVAPIQPWLATARRREASATPAWAPDRRRHLERRARRAARRGLLLARRYRNNLPHALREAGLLAAVRGRRRRARRLLDRSVAVAEHQAMRYERALSLQARGEVGTELGWPGAGDDLAEGAEEVRALTSGFEQPDTVTVSLVDRFDRVLEAGQDIAAALSAEAVHAAIHRAAEVLLRGERCVVLEVGPPGEGRFVAVAGDTTGGFSASLAEEAVQARRPVRLHESADPSESMVLSGTRSALCAPITVTDEVVACFYVEHRSAAALFGDEAHHLAQFVSTLAATALQNAAGFTEIQELTQSLERRVQERTAALAETNEELTSAYERERESAERLARLDQLKTEFMAMAAHDLRTPMTVITGFASGLRDRWDDLGADQRIDLLDRIDGHSRRLSQFLENLLQFARIESGELSYDLDRVDLAGLVERTVAEQVAGSRTSHRATVTVWDQSEAVGDEQRIWQVLTNLLSNAVKFSPEDEPIEVVVARRGDQMEVTVEDHGPGISEEDQATLFRKFSQVEHHDGPKRAMGTGLGLYICRSLVEAQGGTMSVSSEVGQGARFTFTLPVADGSAANDVREGVGSRWA